MGLGQAPRRAAGAHLPATRMAPFHLVVRLLGPPDDRGALGHNRAQAVTAAPVRDRRAPLREAAAAPAPEPARRALVALDRALHRYEQVPDESWPKRLIRGAALREAERWIVARQEADGSWGGIQPPMVYSTIALVLQGYPLDHPVLAAAIAGLDAFALEDDHGRRIEACQSPVWDTALAAIALVDAGTAPDDPAMKAARDWLLDEEVTVVGDWAVRRPNLAPGGWAFEFQNVHYPDIDDTAEVVLALRRAAAGPAATQPATGALDWLVGMQSSDGGWGAFDADNTSTLPTQLPFFDFGAVTDPPTADVTAHVVEMLACEPHPLTPASPGALQRGLDWLAAHQERRRVILGALGRQLRLRDGCGAAGSDRRRSTRQGPDRGRRCPVAPGAPEPRRRLGRGPALLCRTRLGRAGSVHRLPNSLGADRPYRRRREGPPGDRAGHRVACHGPDRRRHLGRAVVHGHRASPGISR